MKKSRTGVVVSALPSLIMLGMFYSLAIHMHRSLGGWPTTIGERGFSPALRTHANLAVHTFQILILSIMFAVPAAIVLCFVVKSWRRFIPYLALYAALLFVCWGCMQLAPAPFLNWWWD